MINVFKRLHQEEAGQDLIEYALVALIVALGALAGMGSLASSINNEFDKAAGSLT
jgi:pilus assembly protein Flp/PilA